MSARSQGKKKMVIPYVFYCIFGAVLYMVTMLPVTKGVTIVTIRIFLQILYFSVVGNKVTRKVTTLPRYLSARQAVAFQNTFLKGPSLPLLGSSHCPPWMLTN